MLPPDLLPLARSQLGLVTRSQLHDLDCSQGWISRRRATGLLRSVLPGVMLVAPAPDNFEMRCRAVNLWLGAVGFVGGRAAGELYGLRRMRQFPIEAIVPRNVTRASPSWIALHRTAWYSHQDDRTVLDSGVIAASPRRLLFSLAAHSKTQRWFNAAADDAWHHGLTTPAEMEQYLDRHRCKGKDGVARIEAWLERWLDRARPSQSYFERDIIAALEDAGLPPVSPQHPLQLVDGRIIHLDIAWPSVRLAVEPGHTRFHDPDADALRDLGCAEVGWRVIRLSQSARSNLPRWTQTIAQTYHERRTLLMSQKLAQRGPPSGLI